MKIVIPGGTGQVGRVLTRALRARGHEVVLLSRTGSRSSEAQIVVWDGRTLGPWSSELDGADVVVNLAGRQFVSWIHEADFVLSEAGFTFQFPHWPEAARDLLAHRSPRDGSGAPSRASR
jgi:NAD dependent epimerase/dehydratase family enzyme